MTRALLSFASGLVLVAFYLFLSSFPTGAIA